MPGSNPHSGSCCPTPRLKAISVELEPRAICSVRLGVRSCSAVMSTAPVCTSVSPDTTDMAIGTSISVSSRRRAVTTTSPTSSAAVSAGIVACGSPTVAAASCAIAGVAAIAARLAPRCSHVRVIRAIVILPLPRLCDALALRGAGLY